MECNETIVCGVGDDHDVLLYYNNLIDVNCKNVEKVAVNYTLDFLFDIYSMTIEEANLRI